MKGRVISLAGTKTAAARLSTMAKVEPIEVVLKPAGGFMLAAPEKDRDSPKPTDPITLIVIFFMSWKVLLENPGLSTGEFLLT